MPKLSEAFEDKINNWGQDKLPNLRQYHASNDDPFPFADEPSGSHWDLSHLEWLHVNYYWDCDVRRLFTKKSRLEESGAIAQFLQERLNLTWTEVTTGDHEPGSFYDRLSALATWIKATPVYEPQSVPQSSSPAGSQGSDDLNKTYSTHGVPPSDSVSIRATLETSPSARKSQVSTLAPEESLHRATHRSTQPSATNAAPLSQDWDSSPEPSSSDENSEYRPMSSSPSAPTEDIVESKVDDKLEKDVEYVIITFQSLMTQAYKSTAAGITLSEAKEQDLTFEFA